MNPRTEPAPQRPDAEDRLDEDTVRLLTERRENPGGPVRPREDVMADLKARRPLPDSPR